MEQVIRLGQGEVAEILAATLAQNNMKALDVAFDISSGELVAVIEVAPSPLHVRQEPEATSYTDKLIERWRDGRTAGYGPS